jgi:hypothetical protein
MKLLNTYRITEFQNIYGVNSQGYRCPEFNDILWEDSILMFGCSHVFGVGLIDEETAAHQLSLLIKQPVINLGIGASSCTYQWVNSTILRKHHISPKAVIYNWPESSRQSIFYDKDQYETKAMGWWSAESEPTYSGILLDPFHSKHITSYMRDNIDLLWQCPVLHYSIEYVYGTQQLISRADLARDNSHAGPKTNKIWAETIANDLEKIYARLV